MTNKPLHPLLMLALLLGTAAGPAAAVKPQITYTTIQVKDMHCATCAKKIAAKLYVLPGVKEVRADVKKNIAYVVPQKSKNVSPRAMWQAIETAGFEPVRMTGPAGDFTSEPGQ